MNRHAKKVFAAVIACLALACEASAAAASGPLLLAQGSEDLSVAPFGQIFGSIEIGNDRSIIVIQGKDPEHTLVYIGTVQQDDFDRLLTAMAAMRIGVQPSCASVFNGGILGEGDSSVSDMRFVWFGRRRVHSFTMGTASPSPPSCSPAVVDFISALGRLFFLVVRDPKTVVIY
jgi:hypothetical protein